MHPLWQALQSETCANQKYNGCSKHPARQPVPASTCISIRNPDSAFPKCFVVTAQMLSVFSTAIMQIAVYAQLTCITLRALLQAIQAASAG